MSTILHPKPFPEQLQDNLDTVWKWRGRVPDRFLWRLLAGLIKLKRKYRGDA